MAADLDATGLEGRQDVVDDDRGAVGAGDVAEFLVAAKSWPVTSTTPLSGSTLHIRPG